MNAPAPTANTSPLETALHDVHAILSELLVAADEQYAAVAAQDVQRLEQVTRQQERLAARLGRAEARRSELLGGSPLSDVVAALPAAEAARIEAVRGSVAGAVTRLKSRQSQTAGLLEGTLQLTSQTIGFLQRMLSPNAPAYGARGVSCLQRSVLLDSRA